jgi:hypothetical protein
VTEISDSSLTLRKISFLFDLRLLKANKRMVLTSDKDSLLDQTLVRLLNLL